MVEQETPKWYAHAQRGEKAEIVLETPTAVDGERWSGKSRSISLHY